MICNCRGVVHSVFEELSPPISHYKVLLLYEFDLKKLPFF